MAAWPGWQRDILYALGAPYTPSNVALLSAWQGCEGGSADWNPLNTTQPAAGATDYNSVGVKNYASKSSGIGATAATLTNGRYSGIVRDLKAGNVSAALVAQRNAAEFNTWGTGTACILVTVGAAAGPPSPPGTRGPTPRTKPAPKHRTTPLHLPEGVRPPGEYAPRPGNVLHNWKYLTHALGGVLPSQDVHVRAVTHRMGRVFTKRKV